MTTNEILSRFNKVSGKNGNYMAQCPAHKDNRPSLSVTEKDDKTLLHCFAGCTSESITAAVGLEMKDLFNEPSQPQPQKHRIIATYDYRDLKGKLIFQVCRLEPKTFRQRQPNPSPTAQQDGKPWLWNLRGITPILYNLQQVAAAIQKKQPIYLVEGEKDCQTLIKQGFVATTAPMGSEKWRKEFSLTLKNANIYIIPDNDRAGKLHLQKICETLPKFATAVHVLDWQDEKSKDITEFLEDGGNFETLSKNFKKFTPQILDTDGWNIQDLIKLPDIKRKFTIDNILARGVFLFGAGPKTGKSWLVLDMATSVAQGTDFWGHKTEKGEVLYFALEDQPTDIRERLQLMKHDLPKLANFNCYFDAPGLVDSDVAFLTYLESKIKLHPQTKLVIVDTFADIRNTEAASKMSYYGDKADIRNLRKIQQKYDISVILVHHSNKGTHENPMHSMSGTNGLLGGTDGNWILERPKLNEPNAKIYINNRRTKSHSFNLYFNEDTFRWENKGEAHSRNTDKDEQFMYTLDEFLGGNETWKGTATELWNKMLLADNEFKMPPAIVVKTLKRLEYLLKSEYDVGLEFNRTHGVSQITLNRVQVN